MAGVRAPSPSPGRRVGLGSALAAAGAVAGYGLAIETVGLVVSSLLFLFFLWAVVDRVPPTRSLALAAVGTAVTWLLFDVMLRVRFPRPPFGL